MKRLLITIDGPAGAGKTTISRLLSRRLGYAYLDTGALYRGVAWAVHRGGVDPDDEAAVTALCRKIDLKFVPGPDRTLFYVNGEDATDAIRTPAVTMLSSRVSAHPGVRACLLDRQRAMGREKAVVVEGRDMGTVVFPEADVKFFLTASLEVRAARRFAEMKTGTAQTLVDVTTDMQTRDRNDASRAVAPLKPADDAILIDASVMPVETVIERMLEHIHSST